jgi:Na+-transporting methylmalonyl-CoA/oxaloacetate decarboxylase gamma subunit
MPLTLKIAIVLLCFALCGAGTFIASIAREEAKQPQKMNAIPVENQEIAQRVWIVAARL